MRTLDKRCARYTHWGARRTAETTSREATPALCCKRGTEVSHAEKARWGLGNVGFQHPEPNLALPVFPRMLYLQTILVEVAIHISKVGTCPFPYTHMKKKTHACLNSGIQRLPIS